LQFFSKDDAAAGESCVIAQTSLLPNTVWKPYALNSSFCLPDRILFSVCRFQKVHIWKKRFKVFLTCINVLFARLNVLFAHINFRFELSADIKDLFSDSAAVYSP